MTSATPAATAALADAVGGYAARFHAAVGVRHHVASPLGAWLLLALIGGPAETLGMPAADAARHARQLLDDPHPAVASATAAWTLDAPPAAAEWLAGLPAVVARGPVPTQEEADAWAREHTLGMIDHFPLTIDHEVRCVLANALATRISWTHPFTTTRSNAFRSAWRERVRTVLRTPERGHECGIARHAAAGLVGVHRARAAEGLAVTSVIAASDVPGDVVLAAAHDAARDRIEPVPLAELPLGDGPAWSVGESTGTGDRVSAVLPAWSATSEHDLGAPAFGFDEAAEMLRRLFGAAGWDAAQAATARYDREGFEAAAVTAVAVRMSFRPPGRRREAELRFDRPYAVVATATGEGPWAGLPVFSAWVADPADA